MMSDDRDFLHRSQELSIELVVESDARLIFETDGSPQMDLTAADDFVVVFEGVGVEIEVESPSRAIATIGPVSRLEEGGTLMIRVHEFLDGWEF